MGEPVIAPVTLDLDSLALNAHHVHEEALASADPERELEDHIDGVLDIPVHNASAVSLWPSEYHIPPMERPPMTRTRLHHITRSRKQRDKTREGESLARRDRLAESVVDKCTLASFKAPKLVSIKRAQTATSDIRVFSLAADDVRLAGHGFTAAGSASMAGEDLSTYKYVEWDGKCVSRSLSSISFRLIGVQAVACSSRPRPYFCRSTTVIAKEGLARGVHEC